MPGEQPWGGLLDQVGGVQLGEQGAGLGGPDAGEHRGGVRVDHCARVQPEVAEEPLGGGVQGAPGEVEGGRDAE